ncbi:MAG: autotransporter outer membrane beta-barrel domain-containing protein [Dialister sp.]
MKKKWLKGCVLSILAAGVVSTGGVSQAETIDMTAAGNLSGIVISDPTAEVENTYTYTWNKATKTLTGGTITAKTNTKGYYINLNLQLKSSEFDSLKPADINEAVEALSAKVINDLPKDRWRVKARVEIVNDKGQVLRTYEVLSDNVKYDYKNEKYPEASTGKKGDLTGALYTTTLSADDTDSEYDLADHKLLLKWGDGVFMTPDYSEKRKDHIYTAIRGGTNDLILSHKSGSSTSNNKLVITSDSTESTDRFSETYGIYHDGKGKLILQSSETDIIVKGAVSKGIFVGNKSQNDISEFILGGDNGVYRIQIESDEDEDAVGIEAARKGIIHFEVKDPNCKTNIDVKKGVGLYAHDGGQILRKNGANGRINIKTNGYGTAVLAEKGGVINVHLNDVEGDIKTDDDEKSQITTNVYGDFNGNAVGNVNLSLFGRWNGNFDSTKDLAIRGSGVWSGSSAKDKINTLTMDPGALWKIPDVEKLPEIGDLKGSKSGVKRSYIDMGKGNLTIHKLSGNFTFNYQHEKDAPATIIGGDVRIKAAEPLMVEEEGVGEGKQIGSVPTTITISTPSDGIDLTNTALVDEVLEHLANKVYYEAYPSGERKLTGTVEIAEGLTSASISKSLSDVKWDEKTGQGHKEEKTQYPHTDFIFGNPEIDKAYEKNITNQDGKLTYTFDKDTTIIKKIDKDPRSFGWGGLYLATINNFGNNKFNGSPSKGGPSFTVDMKRHNLRIQTNISPQEGGTGSQPMWTSAGIGAYREGTITFDNPGVIEIDTTANYYYGSAIRASTAQATDKGAHVIINNSNNNPRVNFAVKIRGGITSPGYEMNYRALEVVTQNGGAGNSIVIKGLVDIETQGGAATMFARGSGSYISVGGGRIIAKDYDAMWTAGKTARIDVNMRTGKDGEVTDAGNKTVEILGSAATTTMWYGGYGTINLGLTNSASSFTGNFYGQGSQNLWLRSGATWKNTATVYNPWSGETGMKDLASNVTWLHGGNSSTQAGNIFQESVHDLTIDHIDGYTNIYMAHDMDYIVPEFEKDANGKDKVDGEGNKIKNPDGGKNRVFGKIGNVIIKNAHRKKVGNQESDAFVSLITDNTGLNTDSVKTADRDRVSDVLNQLANKLYYSAYKDGERNLRGRVMIAEGLTSKSASIITGDITFKDEKGQGEYKYTPAKEPAPEQDIEKMDMAITGDMYEDLYYVDHGIYKDGVYNFTKKESTVEANKKIKGGVWELGGTYAAVSNSNGKKPTVINLNNNKLNIISSKFSGIAATESGSHLVINNAGPIDITVAGKNEKDCHYAAGIYGNTGAVIDIHNGGDHLEDKVLKIRAATDPTWTGGSAGIKARNGIAKGCTTINVDGLVDIEVDGDVSKDNPGADTFGGKTGLSATASEINIGGGSVKVRNGYAAFWAYGEFVSQNTGVIRANVKRDSKGDVIDAGNNRMVVEGDFSTRGGMGSKGQIYLGLSTSESYWKGNYADSQGYGVSPGQHGFVNLYMKKGSYWKGFANGAMNVKMDGKDTRWIGFNVNSGMQLSLQNGATWYNAITKDQKGRNPKKGEPDMALSAQVKELSAKNGVIDMTGKYAFLVEPDRLQSGKNDKEKKPITEMPNGITGDVIVENYKGTSTVIYRHDKTDPKKMIGGDFIINKAEKDSMITFRTDNSGLNMGSEKAADKNLVSETLNALANKLYYKAYVNGETNLKGKVEIAEGLTAQSVSKRLEDMTFKKENGQGQYLFTPAEDRPDIPDTQTETSFGKAILGTEERDTYFINTGVLKDGVYRFSKDTTFAIDGRTDKNEQERDLVYGDNWVLRNLHAAISGALPQKDKDGNPVKDSDDQKFSRVNMDMNGKKLTMNIRYDNGNGAAISAIGGPSGAKNKENGGRVEIHNAGPMDINMKSEVYSIAMFVDRGGKILVHNGGGDEESKIIKLRASTKAKKKSAVIKSMNGAGAALTRNKTESEITIDGLVDILADGQADSEGYTSNEGVSAVASTINIGGGTIRAINGAWAALRAYGEFVSKNYGIINLNAEDVTYGADKEGSDAYNVKSFKAGKRRVQIEGDIVTNGGMGSKGQINIGLVGDNSYWKGNYGDAEGYGVTPGQLGAVNLKMKNGSYWRGFANGSMNVEMEGKNTRWTGFNINDGMQLMLKDGATWYNAVTPDQKNKKKEPAFAKVKYLVSDHGVIDMTGKNTFTAIVVPEKQDPLFNPYIVENKDGITGNVVVDNYKGNTTVLYKHDKTDPKKMIGGDFIINKAEKDSMITLRTDNEGMNALSGKAVERNKVSEILNALANKLYYTAYKDGETNLKGKVEIAEGLTAQSASYRLEDMTFKKENGQGQYLFTPATEDKPDTPKPGEDPKPPTPDKPEPPVIYGPKQTAMMRGAKSAMTTTMLSMRDNMTTMTQRLGDIHEGTEEGIWARTYGGKANYDKDQTKTKESFWGVQIGADKKQKSGWHTGISFDYKDGNATYELGGKGDPKLYTLGIYGTKAKANGEYIDVVAKAGRGQNDYTVYNDMGHKLKGDYKANAMGLSVEYGKRIEKDNMYLTPQIQLSYMKLQGTDYDAISDYAGGKKMHVEQDGMTSLVGRIGIAAGKRTDKTDLYLKANLLHEFKGTTASTFSAENEPTATVDQDFGDTWAELTVGINHNIDKDKMIYADITRSFGGDYEMEWKANAGIRLRF